MKTPTPIEMSRLHFAAYMRGVEALAAFEKYKNTLEIRNRLQEEEERLNAEVFATRRELNFQIERQASS